MTYWRQLLVSIIRVDYSDRQYGPKVSPQPEARRPSPMIDPERVGIGYG